MTCRCLAGEDARTCRRTQWTGCISLAEGHAASGQALEVWGLVEGILAIQGGITPAEVVGKNHQHVEWLVSRNTDAIEQEYSYEQSTK